MVDAQDRIEPPLKRWPAAGDRLRRPSRWSTGLRSQVRPGAPSQLVPATRRDSRELDFTSDGGRPPHATRDPAWHSQRPLLFVGLLAGWPVAFHVAVAAAGTCRVGRWGRGRRPLDTNAVRSFFMLGSTSQRQLREETSLPRPGLRCGGQSCG